MRLHVPAIIAATFVLVLASSESRAQCPFQHPAKAKKFTTALVQAFVPCDEANTTTEGNVPSCAPARTFAELNGTQPTNWFWGPKSSGSVTFAVKGSDIALAASLADIRDFSGRTTSTGQLAFLIRATIADPPANSMTVIDVPVTVAFPLVDGKGKIKTTLSALPNPALVGVLTGSCTSLELISSAYVRDATSTTFAVSGLYLP